MSEAERERAIVAPEEDKMRKKIKKHIKNSGQPQKEFAKEARISQSTLSRFMSGSDSVRKDSPPYKKAAEFSKEH